MPMPIAPDTKDWTWVLERPCPECGFVAGTFDPTTASAVVRAQADAWAAILDDPRAARRPSDDRWSALEYACHVRDVFRVYEERVRRMLEEDGPHFANWDQDATAIDDDYAGQDPATVRDALHTAAETLAARLDTVEGGAWERTGFRSDGARFTIASLTRYMVHDPIHHVHDVKQGFAQLGSTA